MNAQCTAHSTWYTFQLSLVISFIWNSIHDILVIILRSHLDNTHLTILISLSRSTYQEGEGRLRQMKQLDLWSNLWTRQWLMLSSDYSCLLSFAPPYTAHPVNYKLINDMCWQLFLPSHFKLINKNNEEIEILVTIINSQNIKY